MTREQFLLIKLSEECAEVSQRALKQIQFGINEVQEGNPFTNAQRLKSELLDLFCIVKILEDSQAFEEFTGEEFDLALENKIKKLQKYVDYSYSLGVLPEIKI